MIFKIIHDITLIPVHLVKQVPDTDVKLFYHFLRNLKEMPHNVIEVFQDKNLIIKGFAWSVIDSISKEWHVNTVSIEKDLQGTGKYLKEYIDHLKNSLKGSAIKKVTWCTDRPAFYERLGFKRSNDVYLEYDLQHKDEKNG